MMKNTQQYEERAFAFIDVLGFRNIISEMDGNPELFEKLKAALEWALSVEEANSEEIVEGRKLSKSEIIAFSDCIVISAPTANIFSVVFQAKLIAGIMLAKGFLCRGGIAIGKGYHQGRIVFGQGFNDAYKLEQSAAIYPRVVVSEAVSILLNDKSTSSIFYSNKILKQDVDGCWFIDIFKPPFLGVAGSDKVQFARAARSAIIKNIEHEKLGIAAKSRWLANQFNAFVVEVCLESLVLSNVES